MSTPPSYTTLRDRLHALADDTVRGTDVLVLDVRVRGAKGRTYVEVIADTPAGIGVDQLARLSRELGFAFDTHDAISGAYNLSVLSPGAKEPLRPHQYPRHVGRVLAVELVPVEADAKPDSVTGTLLRVSDSGLVLEQSDGTERSIPFETIQQARVKLPW